MQLALDLLISKLLPVTALILSVVNGFSVFLTYMRDKPNLVVSPVHPEVYQCWVRLKDVVSEGKTIRRYAFLSYFGVANGGLRDVAVDQWRLRVTNQLGLWQYRQKSNELKPYNIPEPQCSLGDDHVKLIRAFGQTTQNFQSSSNMVRSGDSISGMACWMYSIWGEERWDPKLDKNRNIVATLVIRNVFGKKSQCRAIFKERTIESLKVMMPTIGAYLEDSDHFLI